MSVPTERVIPATSAQATTVSRRIRPGDEPTWEYDEITGVEFQPGPVARLGRRLWLGVVLALVLGSLGFLDQSQAGGASTDLPLTITSPAVGSTNEGAVVTVQGVATDVVGSVQLGIVVGAAVLGWTIVEVDRAGPVEASIPVFAPPVSVEVELLVVPLEPQSVAAHTAAAMEASAAERRAFRLRPGGPVGLWSATALGSGAKTIVVVSGCAPIGVRRVQVRLVGHDGRLLATSVAVVTREDARPGAAGGYALGIGSFQARLAAGAAIADASVRVEVDWRDEIGGEWGTSVMTVAPASADPPRA